MQLSQYLTEIEDTYLPIQKFKISTFLAEKYLVIKKEEIDEILENNLSIYLQWEYEEFSKKVEEEILNIKLNLISLVSGWWTTMESLIKKLEKWEINLVNMVWVIASKYWIWAIDKAILYKIHTVILNKFHAKDQNTLNDLIKLFKTNIIIWNWWLPLIPKEIIEKFQWIILNQHPWPLRKNHLDFGGKGMYWIRVTASRIIYLLETWATWNELFTESTVHIMTEQFDEWYSVWVKKLNIEKEIGEYRGQIINKSEDEKEELLKNLISDIQAKLLVLEHENVAETIKTIWETKITEKHSSYDEILVPKENVWILEESKQKAIKLYPNG